jgi:cyclopropane fatty-acyl-phospholipid synthase-like methyltransferase
MSFADYYGQKAVYTKISRGRLQGILALAGDLSGKKVLDIGCGGGELGREIKKHYPQAKVFGVDVSPGAVAEAEKFLDGAALVDLEQDQGHPFLAEKYDLIVISEVLEHLFRPEDLLIKVKQFNCPVIITIPNLLFWKNRLNLLLGYFDYTDTGLMDRGHIRFFSLMGLRRLVESLDYEIVGECHRVPTRGTKWLAKIWPGLFAHNFIIKIKSKN